MSQGSVCPPLDLGHCPRAVAVLKGGGLGIGWKSRGCEFYMTGEQRLWK